ncbi:AbiEi antitoxin N-terminal domain-containing protein [Allosphingosinicella vermicomposti]|uniref:AbiEi antitoxin N-terminal domain-containing protein n=1 Tax=Allosphingosinicella vermicomposti TaxID=614671 RepID=UPI000D106148|nr:AbiEi antitoxin N-terminal domain-containing protein [Allosphingosinicella vermicomposti]
MKHVSEKIMKYAAGLPEGAPIVAKALLHLGSRAAVDQALSRLVQRGALLRAGRGLYVRPVESRFGTRAPAAEKVVAALAQQCGETVTPSGAAAANALGLTEQVPVRSVYLTSGPSRRLKVGRQTVELKHAPRWQLALAGRPAGEAVRALAWLGQAKAGPALTKLKRTLPPSAFREMVSVSPLLPPWIAKPVSEIAAYG